jgi:phosphopantothenate-cysteine ligase
VCVCLCVFDLKRRTEDARRDIMRDEGLNKVQRVDTYRFDPPISNTLSDTMSSSVSPSIDSFVPDFPEKLINDLKLQLDSFVVDHATHHRPIALVSSGGTISYLEQNSVRCLDNFSTGLRGAISVEEFLKRGYAVIHLWREGSAAPFARVISQTVGLKQCNHALNVESLGRLFSAEADEEDQLVRAVLDEERDPFLSDPSSPKRQQQEKERKDEITLNRAIIHSTRVHKALRERSTALEENRILTIPFRTVEEYLARLQLASEALKDCQSLALVFLCAAVSDFYIPNSERATHKIQSHGSNGLVLNLFPVPKMIGRLRSTWAPDAFVVSFKLETDKTILQQKAKAAVEKYGIHVVIGNILQTRHERVWVLSPEDQREKIPTNADGWSMSEIVKPRSSDQDSLEWSIIDMVVQSHFEYISWHFQSNGSVGLQAAERAQTKLFEKKRRIRRELAWKRVRSVALDVAGTALAILLSYSINMALQRRLRGR